MKSLKELMCDSSPVTAPSVFDGISALLVQELGFPAAYIGSWSTSATRFGIPDLGYINLTDMAELVARLRGIIDIPLVVDAEGGWGNPLHVIRGVKVLERAGANAIHLEDGEFGKHLGATAVLPVGKAVDKIKAALDARDSDEFTIIARSDALAAEGPDATIDRLLAYQDAGADALFLAPAGLPDVKASTPARLVEGSRVPIVVVNDPNCTTAEHGAHGAAMVLYYGVTNYAAEQGMREALTHLKADEPSVATDGRSDFRQFDKFLGIEAHRSHADKYSLSGS